MSTLKRHMARKEKINFAASHLELMLGQWSVRVVRFREMWNKITVFWQRSGNVQKEWSSLSFYFQTVPGNSCALCLFMAYRINVTCNESVWCDFVKHFTALRLVELFIVNLNSLTTVNITWWWLRIKWSVTKSETTHHLATFYPEVRYCFLISLPYILIRKKNESIYTNFFHIPRMPL